jgi:hypothetical protein
VPALLCKIVFGKDHSHRQRYQPKKLIFTPIFIFQIFLLLSAGTSRWISCLYMESTDNSLFSCRFHRNSSVPYVSCTWAKRWERRVNHATLDRIKSLLNVTFTFGGEVSMTKAVVSLLWWTILYKAGYCFQSVVLPSPSSWKRIFDPSLTENDLKAKEIFLCGHQTIPKCANP